MARSLTSPSFVGREAELAALRRAFARATSGEAAMVLLAGEAGVGKTRLLAEFLLRGEAAALAHRLDLLEGHGALASLHEHAGP